MSYPIGWFATGRGSGSFGLLEAMQEAIKSGYAPAEIAFVFMSREAGEGEDGVQLSKLVDLASWQCLLQILHSRVGHLRANKVQRLQACQARQFLQPRKIGALTRARTGGGEDWKGHRQTEPAQGRTDRMHGFPLLHFAMVDHLPGFFDVGNVFHMRSEARSSEPIVVQYVLSNGFSALFVLFFYRQKAC